jgi:hypothetical protein
MIPALQNNMTMMKNYQSLKLYMLQNKAKAKKQYILIKKNY